MNNSKLMDGIPTFVPTRKLKGNPTLTITKDGILSFNQAACATFSVLEAEGIEVGYSRAMNKLGIALAWEKEGRPGFLKMLKRPNRQTESPKEAYVREARPLLIENGLKPSITRRYPLQKDEKSGSLFVDLNDFTERGATKRGN